MKHYRSYMDRQEISAGTHETLMNLEAQRKAPRTPWLRYGALAACAALVLGIGVWKLPSVLGVRTDGGLRDAVFLPPSEEQDSAQGSENESSFVAATPEGAEKLAFPAAPDIQYQDRTGAPEAAASRAFAPGTFNIILTMEDIQTIFWGPEGKPEADHPKLEQGELPWTLFWDGYTLNGCAWYDGQGQLTELSICGGKEQASFTLELRLGALPFSCVVFHDGVASDVLGTAVTGWRRVYDRNGDGVTDYICGSEFMTDHNIGVRFENVNASMRSEYGGNQNMELGGAEEFNALFVRQALTGGLYLDHLMTHGDVPAWRDARFDTLDQARQEADFAPYLPTAEPEAYTACTGEKEFFGRLSYQEGTQNMLFVRWTWDGCTMEVDVQFPEGDSAGRYEPMDVSMPERYDTRLYEIPWCDSVPEEYRISFYNPAFRAEDMSPDVVEARAEPNDAGGDSFNFTVLHPDGTAVGYHCYGAARQVWELVESTLP